MDVFIGVDIDRVQRGLLTDGRHQVEDGPSLVGNHGFVRGQTGVVNAIAVKGMASRWVRWTEPEGAVVACSLSAVLAASSRGEG
jgi:hypothetical protein